MEQINTRVLKVYFVETRIHYIGCYVKRYGINRVKRAMFLVIAKKRESKSCFRDVVLLSL